MSMKFYEVLGVPEGSVIETRTVGSSESGFKYHAGVTCAYDPLSEKDTIALLLGYLEYRPVLEQETVGVSKETQEAFEAIKKFWPDATHVMRVVEKYGKRPLVIKKGGTTLDTVTHSLGCSELDVYKLHPLYPPENPWRRVERIETAEVIEEAQP